MTVRVGKDEKMRLRDEILHLKNDNRWHDDSSRYTTDDEECYQKKRKERESDRLLYDNHDKRDTRRTFSRPSSSPSDLTRLRYLINREEQQNWFSRHSCWWVRIGDEPYLPLHSHQEGPVPQSSSSSLPSHDVIMQASTVEAHQQDPTAAAIAAIEGVEGESSILPYAGEGSEEIAQDVIMAVVALGVEEASSTLQDPSGVPGLSTD